MVGTKKPQGTPGRGERAGFGWRGRSREKGKVEFREGEIRGVRVETYQQGIPLPDWSNVRGALHLYTSGQIESARDGAVELGAVIRNDLGIGATELLSKLMPQMRPASEIVDRMLEAAKPEVDTSTGGFWDRRFQYIAPPPLVDTTIEFERAPAWERDRYLLGIYSTRGRGPEVDLARALQIDRATRSQTVHVELAPASTDTFRVDMEAVGAALTPVFHRRRRIRRHNISGADIADHFMSRSATGTPQSADFVLGEKDGFRVSLGLSGIADHIDYRVDRKNETWKREETTLSGPLETKYGDEPGFQAPSLVIKIVDARSKSYRDVPVITPERKAAMTALAEEIKTAFEPK